MRLSIRPATPRDKEAVLAFCRETWGWGDYIPLVWDRWLADPSGRLLVAARGQEPIGLARVRFLGTAEAWLEGLRVAPQERKGGVAGRLTARCLKIAQDQGARVVRFVTMSTNLPVHRLAAQLGFRRAAGFSIYQASASPGEEVPLRQASPQDWERLKGLLRSPLFRAWGGLYAQDWSYRRLNSPQLRERLEAGEVFILASKGRAQFMAIVRPGEEALEVNYLDGKALEEGARALRALAAVRQLPLVRAHLPDIAPLKQAFEKAGYQSAWEGQLWVFELVLGAAHGGRPAGCQAR